MQIFTLNVILQVNASKEFLSYAGFFLRETTKTSFNKFFLLMKVITLDFLVFAGFIDFIGFMSYIPFFAKLLRTILENPLSIAELERARERVKQHDLTFKPKKKAKEPKSWEVY